MWTIDNIETTVRFFIYGMTHPVMYVILGAMIAWGAWILIRSVNWSITNNRGLKTKRVNPVNIRLF